MKTAFLLVVLAAVAACANAQYPTCPNATITKGVNVIGDWHGYFLSTSGSTYYQAAATVSFMQSALGNINAKVNLSQPVCTGGCPSHRAPAVEPCVATYEIKCLDASDPTVWGFVAPPKGQRPKCLTSASPWLCDYHMTGTAYQDTGHGAAFYTRMMYEPSIPGPPLHMMPFGDFFTGCPTSANQIQARLIRDM